MTARETGSRATNFAPKGAKQRHQGYTSNVSDATSSYADDLEIDRIVNIHSGNLKAALHDHFGDFRSEEEDDKKRKLEEMATKLADMESHLQTRENELKVAKLHSTGLAEQASIMQEEMEEMEEEINALKGQAAKCSSLEAQLKERERQLALIETVFKQELA